MKLGILITSYNRPNYLLQCLNSIKSADIHNAEILIVDDASTSKDTIDILHNSGYMLMLKKKNGGVNESLLWGCNFLFDTIKCDIITNLDSDAIVKPDFLHRLLDLKNRFRDNLITGFNCTTKNKNGTERHPVVSCGSGWNIKKSVGGINLMFDHAQYIKWIKPALIECIQKGGNWDHKACLNANRDNYNIVCVVPSVVQHIGIESSLGHSIIEAPDVADDFNNRLSLNNITLVGADCINIERLIHAANISCKNIEFNSVKLFSSIPSSDKWVINIPHINNKKEYGEFMLKKMVDYIDTEYILIIQHDGFVVRSEAWTDEFLKYDYVGAVWMFRKNDYRRVGNGGFSLRTKKLHTILKEDNSIVLKNDSIIKNFAEDHNIGYIYRDYLENKYGIKFAPEDVCNMFSIEAWGQPSPLNKYNGSFGFHGFCVDFSNANLSYVPYILPNLTIF